MQTLKVVVLLCMSLQITSVFAEQFVAGTDYAVLSSKLRNNSAVTDLLAKDPQKLQVLFFFSYGCPACAKFDPAFEKWLLQQDLAKIAVYRFPAMFEESWAEYAKLYYIMQDLQPTRNLNAALFKAIQQQGLDLTDEAAMQDFFVQHGYSAKDFVTVYKSSALQSQLKNADQIAYAYNLVETPTIAINSPAQSYSVTFDQSGNDDSRMLAIVDYLIAK